jgi:hypothetical protein
MVVFGQAFVPWAIATHLCKGGQGFRAKNRFVARAVFRCNDLCVPLQGNEMKAPAGSTGSRCQAAGPRLAPLPDRLYKTRISKQWSFNRFVVLVPEHAKRLASSRCQTF